MKSGNIRERFAELSPERQAQLLGRYERIIELSRLLNSVLELPRLLHQVTEAACEITQAEASSILLVDRPSGDLYFEAASGVASERVRRVVVPMDSIAGWVVQHGEPAIIEDAQKDKRHFQGSDIESAFVTRSLIAVPLSVKGEVIGTLEAVNKRKGQSFDQDDIDLLMTLAAQAAVAVENARLFQQSDLISEMVHELRTPLTAILAYADMLLTNPLSEEQRTQFLETIRSEAERLTNMTNEFLELARLSSGRARLARTRVDLAQVVQTAVNVVRPQAIERGIHLTVRAAKGLPPVLGDPQRLHQVALNLLSNAIKYNRPNGSVYVSVDADPEAAHMLRVQVRDTGRGIAPEHLDRLFEKFFRVADAEGYARGTGLGLSIAKEIIQVHGGRIWVESQVGQGTTFFFTLPVAGDGDPSGAA